MSDCMTQDMAPELWTEIIELHWSYLDTEESPQKMEKCKKLRARIKDFLCTVSHDRKFFLTETAQVLRKTITETEDFSAFKTIIGFESISQYASNLYTKPWRKEYRVIKTYSGFFQHEIKANLLDAEKLFIAMGYRSLSDDIYVLDGPICPDQLCNVARDAMVAYMECQIIKNIYAGLLSLGVSCTWLDVYKFREKHIGSTSQAIKEMAYNIQERSQRKEKHMNADNYYAVPQQIPHASMTPIAPQCHSCAYHKVQTHHMIQQQPQQCSIHPTNNQYMMSSYPAGNYHQPHGYGSMQPHMSHSRSLEHYHEPHGMLPHRHSFDHQQQGCTAQHHYQMPGLANVYEPTYDCLDGISLGDSSVSYAAVAAGTNSAYTHPYNAPGNRYPLPVNISNQLASHYASSTAVPGDVPITPAGSAYRTTNDHYATVGHSKYTPSANYGLHQQQHTYSNANHQLHTAPPPIPHTSHQHLPAPTSINSKDLQNYRQQSYPPDFQQQQQLIDFDDQAELTAHDFHAQLHAQHNSFDQYDRRSASIRANMNAIAAAAANQSTFYVPSNSKDQQLVYQEPLHLQPTSNTSNDGLPNSYIYAKPTPRGHRTKPATNAPTATLVNSNLVNDKYITRAELYDNNRKMPTDMNERINGLDNNNSNINTIRRRMSTQTTERDTDLSYESAYDDYNSSDRQESSRRHSPTQAVINQDGIGSFDSWNYVYKQLDRSGYNKDLGERGDLVQSLDFKDLCLENGSDKRKSTAELQQKMQNGEKGKTLEKTQTKERKTSASSQTAAVGKQQNANSSSMGAIKKTVNKSALKSSSNKSSINGVENHNGNTTLNRTNKSKTLGSNKTTFDAGNNKKTDNHLNGRQTISTTAVENVLPAKEWPCKFCTYLNPDTKRICEICSKSKDFNSESSHKPTCV